MITANQEKFFEKIIKENYIRKDKIRNLAENIKEERNFYDKDEEAEWGQYNEYENYDYFYNKIKELLEENE